MELARWSHRLPPSSGIGDSLDPDSFDVGPNLLGGGIGKDRLAQLIGKPDTHRQRIEHRTQLALTATQCLFRLVCAR